MAVDWFLSVAAFYTVIWCCFHSVLLSQGCSSCLQRLTGNYWRWHRIVYNIVSVLTLLPLLVYLQLIRELPLFQWDGLFAGLRLMILAAALLLFFYGSRIYDFHRFMGITQLRSGQSSVLLSENAEFQQEGILGLIRHPWYSGGILLLWSSRSEYGVAVCIIYTILTAYLIIGAFLEEKRLLEAFGEEYEKYRREVSMFFPYKWIKKRLLQWR